MNFVLALERLIRLVRLALLDLGRGKVAPFLLGMVVLHTMLFVLCGDPTHPLWSWAMVPLLKLRFGDLYLHYPQSWIGLPTTGSGLRVVADLLLLPVVAIWVVASTRAILDGDRPTLRALGAEVRQHMRFAVPLVFFSTLVWLLLHTLPVRYVLENFSLSYRMRVLVVYGWGILPAALMAPLLYVLPVRMVRDWGWKESLGAAWRAARSERGLTLALGCAPYVVGLPLLAMMNRSATLSNALRPEMVLALMVVHSAVSLFTLHLALDACTRLWWPRRNPRAAGGAT